MDAGHLEAGLALNLQAFRRGLQNASREVRRFGRDFQNSFKESQSAIDGVNRTLNRTGQNLRDFERIAGGIVLSQAFYGAKSAIQDAGAALVSFMNDMEKAQIALEYFLSTPEEAQSFLTQMNDFAATTSFNTNQALALSRKLMAAQFNPNDIRGVMTILNDAAAASGGTAEQMDRIVLALSQIKTNGKLAGQEMRQLGEAGIPIYKILQEQLGLTGEEIMNVGKLGVKGDVAVAAILKGLQERYEGAALRIADTVPGMWETIKDDSKMVGSAIFQAPYEAMEKFLRVWRDTWEEARNLMTEGGLGKVLENMFPPSIHSSIRAIVGSIKSLGKSFLDFMKAIAPVAKVLTGSLTMALGVIMPVLAGVARAVAWLAKTAIDTVPPLKYLLAAITALLVTQVVSKVMLAFWGVLRLGMVAAAVGKAVLILVNAIKALTLAMAKNPVIAVVMALAAALLYLASSSKAASAWLENLMDKIAAIGGFDIDKQLVSKDNELIDVGDFESDLDSMGDAFEDTTDDMEEKAKKLKKYLMSFDEVFNIPEKEDEDEDKITVPDFDFDFDIPDFEEEITDKLPREIKLPEFKWPDLPWWAIRPINIKWNIEPFNWPKIPPPPPALVTLWEFITEPIKWPKFPPMPAWPQWQPFPSLPPWPVLEPFPVPNLQPVLNPVLEWLKDWAKRLGGAWEGAWNPLRNPVLIPNPVPNWGNVFNDVLKDLKDFGDQLREKWGGAWQLPPVTVTNLIPNLDWGKVLEPLGEMAKNWGKSWDWMGQTAASWGATIAESAKQLGTDMAANWGTAWDSLTTSVTNWATSAVGSIKLVGADMAAGWSSSMAQIGAAWTSFSEWFSNGWSTALQAAGGFASDVGGVIMSGIETAWQSIKDGFTAVGEWLGDHWKEVLAGIAVAIIGAIAIFFAPIEGAVAGAAGAVSLGVTAVISAIGLALGGLAVVWDEGREAVIKWGKETGEAISTWASETWDSLKTWASDAGSAISTWVTDTAKAVGDWASDVGTKIKDVWDSGKEKFGDLATTAKQKFGDWTGDAGKKVSTFKTNFGTWMGELPGKMRSGIQSIPSSFTGIMDKLPSPVQKALDRGIAFFKKLPSNVLSAITSIPSKFSSVLDKVPKLVPNIISKIVKPFKELPQKIWEAVKSIPSKIGSVFDGISLPSFGFGSGSSSKAKSGSRALTASFQDITGFAKGGIIDKDSIVRVGEGGRREAIVPMDNASAMQPFADAIANQLRGVLQPTPGTQAGGEDLRPLYVGTLIADERGLKELQRKMNIISAGESRRGGGSR